MLDWIIHKYHKLSTYQTGQVEFNFNQGLIQSSWKICSQGNSMTCSWGSNWSLQTAQSVSVLFSSSVNSLFFNDSITCSGAGGGAELLIFTEKWG